eukprot:742568-Prorocentrum_minimum.AAC.1
MIDMIFSLARAAGLGAPRSNLEGSAPEQCPGLHSPGFLRQADADYGSQLPDPGIAQAQLPIPAKKEYISTLLAGIKVRSLRASVCCDSVCTTSEMPLGVLDDAGMTLKYSLTPGVDTRKHTV